MNITEEIQQNTDLSLGRKIHIAWSLSLPTIIAQITNIAMQYIDAAMVGRLGASASASVGLVSTTIWLFSGVTTAAIYGFAVQIAQAVGAGHDHRAASIFRQGMRSVLIFSLIMAGFAVAIASLLPGWLGAEADIRSDATSYFLIIGLFLPASQLRFYAGGCLQSTGDTKTPGILSVMLCLLNVILNALLIPGPSELTLAGHVISLPGAGLGVTGAALATGLSNLIIGLLLFYIAAFRNKYLKIVWKENVPFERDCLKNALKISVPIALESGAISGAMVVTTRIVAPLGTIAIAANSFAITAESFCYMPGYGLETSATTLVGQCIGAMHTKLARSFAWITTVMGMVIMAATGLVMFFVCPAVFAFLTPDAAVRALGVKVLRIELLAEPFFGASIVAAGAMRGAGDTLIPSIMNLISIWGVRVTLCALLVGTYGLTGAWIAMCAELCFRGIIFLIRLYLSKALS